MCLNISHHYKVDKITGLVIVKTVIFHFLIATLLLDHGKIFVSFPPEAMFNVHGYQRSAHADAFQMHLHFEAKLILLSFLFPSTFPCPFSFTLPFLYPFAFSLPPTIHPPVDLLSPDQAVEQLFAVVAILFLFVCMYFFLVVCFGFFCN